MSVFGQLRSIRRGRSRRIPIFVGLVASLVHGPLPARAQHTPTDPVTVGLVTVATGLDAVIDGVDPIFPTEIVPFPDGSGRLLVATLGGLLRLIDGNGALAAEPYHDTTSPVTINADNGNASFGLTALAFHPDFASPGAAGRGRFYTVEPEITRKEPPPDFPGIGMDQGGSNPAHDRVLYEYTVDDPAAPLFAGSKREVLRIHEHRRGHDVGDLAFDAAGLLFLSSGDTVVSGSAQDLSNVFGVVLRIDPLHPDDTPVSPDPPSANGRYRVPASNPFLADPLAIDEIFAYGLRNPYRIVVDAGSGQLWVSSNGDSSRESVYAVAAGDNLGWPFFEGTLPRQTPPPGFVFRAPVFEYEHDLGVSVNGVVPYRGGAIPALSGRLVFADFLGAGGGARLFHGDPSTSVFSDVIASPGGASLPATIVSLGEDERGTLFLLSTDGTVRRLDPADGGPPPPAPELPRFEDDFEAVPPGGEPADWRDTGADNSLREDPSLFAVLTVGADQALGTTSSETNIHSHVDLPAAETWADYELTGRLLLGDADGGIGVTVLSQYRPGGADAYYRIRRFAGMRTFHLAPHGTSVTGLLDTGLEPLPGVWYRFRVEAEDAGAETLIRAKLWPDGDPEPSAFAIVAEDASGARLRSGTVGFWTMGPGTKALDDVRVVPLGAIFFDGFESGDTSAWSETRP